MKKRSRKKGKGSKGRGLKIKVTVGLGKDPARKLHRFLEVWKEHIHDEIQIHRELLEGKQGFGKHLKSTIAIHEKFVNRIKKL